MDEWIPTVFEKFVKLLEIFHVANSPHDLTPLAVIIYFQHLFLIISNWETL